MFKDSNSDALSDITPKTMSRAPQDIEMGPYSLLCKVVIDFFVVAGVISWQHTFKK